MKKTRCIGQCGLDKTKNHCSGCLRTVKELIEWQNLTHEERQKLLDDYNKEIK